MEQNQDISLILEKLANHFKVKTDKELSEKLDISQSRLSGWKVRNKIDLQDILPILIKEKIDFNWLLGNTAFISEKQHLVNEPPVDYISVGSDSTVMKLARSENEVANLRLEMLKLQDELKKIEDETGIDNSKLKAILLEIDKLKVDKIKAEAERDILLDIIKGNFGKA